MLIRTKHITPIALALAYGALGCSSGDAPEGLARTPAGDGPTVNFDLYHQPLPEIPLPNDAAMWPDPTSRTGMRINSSVVAPTSLESVLRKKLDTLEGWGTFAPITVSFRKKDPNDPRAAIDLSNVLARHRRGQGGADGGASLGAYDPADDVVYLVNLRTGIPVPLDLGQGAFQYIIPRKDKYWRNDTRVTEETLLWETADETVDPLTGQLDPARTGYRPEYDTDFDGVLDRPNLLDPTGCPNQVEVAGDAAKTLARDQCIADNLLTWYERQSDTLIIRPLIPLEQKTEYAVVLTDRLVDPDGSPIRSPFDTTYYPAQEPQMARLRTILSSSDPEKSGYFGDLAGSGLAHVAFAWTYTTEPVQEDLVTIRDGLYGQGPLARLAKDFPAHAEIARAVGLVDSEALAAGAEEPADWKTRPACAGKVENYRILKLDQLQGTLASLVNQGFGLKGPSAQAILDSFASIDYFVAGSFRSPWLMEGGPDNNDPNASFQIDFRTGEGKVSSDEVQFVVAVPKPTPGHAQPFPVAYYAHSYTSGNFEMLGFAGYLAQQGIASVSMNAVSHGLELEQATYDIAHNLFTSACEGPFGSAFLSSRMKDLDNDGKPESGGDYWTAYLFHTRDVVRQTVTDSLQMFRIFKSFDGTRRDIHQAHEGDEESLAGDFDGDGTPDIGGPNNPYFAWGQSLGGIISPFLVALDPDVVAGVPGSGAGGLMDVGSRTINGGAFEGIFLREFGPLAEGVPLSELGSAPTSCTDGEVSLRFQLINVNRTGDVEFGCFNPVKSSEGEGLPDGATVIITNAKNGKIRCARMDKDGRFRIGVPTSVGDKLEVQIWDQPDAIDTYDGDHGCNIDPARGAKRIALINTWGRGVMGVGSEDPTGRVEGSVCDEPDGCTPFQGRYIPAHSPLTALVDGLGLIRQTPDVRRFWTLAGNVVDPGDPINYVRYYALEPLPDPWGKPQPPKGVINFVTVGDPDVPLNAGVSLGRAAGAVPFLTPDAATRYPAWADYATPDALYQQLGGNTPQDIYVDRHVLEGESRLFRESPPAGTCQSNEVPITAADTTCHPNCSPGGDTSACLSDDSAGSERQYCNASGRCTQNPLPDTPQLADKCRGTLFDPDWLGEGSDLWGQSHPSIPVRSARVAAPVGAGDLSERWAPRLMGTPAAPDTAGWTADQRVLAQLFVYVNPTGDHGFDTVDPCQNFQVHRYMPSLIARFFATRGADVYYLSHPSSHRCLDRPLGKGACPFVLPPSGP